MNRSPAPIRLALADMPKRFECIRAGLVPGSMGRRARYTWLEALLMTALAAGALGGVLRLPPDKALQAEPVTVLPAPLLSVPLRISGLETPSNRTSAFLDAAYADEVLLIRSGLREPPIDEPRAKPPRSASDALAACRCSLQLSAFSHQLSAVSTAAPKQQHQAPKH